MSQNQSSSSPSDGGVAIEPIEKSTDSAATLTTVVEDPVAAARSNLEGAGDIIIQTRDLNKTYRSPFSRQGKVALHDLTIDVKRGEIFGLVGLNLFPKEFGNDLLDFKTRRKGLDFFKRLTDGCIIETGRRGGRRFAVYFLGGV